MQNVKIQTLWNLCQELKQKRQDMIEKLSHTQNYLDEQQGLIRSELDSLRQNNQSLSAELEQFQHDFAALQEAWQTLQSAGQAGPSPEQIALEQVALRFERLAGELTFATLLSQQAAPEQMSAWANLGGEFDPFYRRMHDLRSAPTEDPSEFIAEADAFTPGFQQALEAARQELALALMNSSAGAGDGDTAATLAQLQADYQHLQSQLEDLHQAMQVKESQVSAADQAAHAVQSEFNALKANTDSLASDLGALQEKTDQLIELAETYRQIALAAASEAGMQDDSDAAETASEAAESDENSDDGDDASKTEAVKEAVRKKINTVLRHRFGKVPRKVSSALKELNSHAKLDKVFDKALKAETIEEFEADLEG